MTNKRIEKKRTSRPPRRASARALRRVFVEVPCPSCAHPRVERRYLPVIGGMSGAIRCPSCACETSFISAMSRAVGGEAPLDVVYKAPAPEPVEQSTSLEVALREFFGLRRRWTFAT